MNGKSRAVEQQTALRDDRANVGCGESSAIVECGISSKPRLIETDVALTRDHNMMDPRLPVTPTLAVAINR